MVSLLARKIFLQGRYRTFELWQRLSFRVGIERRTRIDVINPNANIDTLAAPIDCLVHLHPNEAALFIRIESTNMNFHTALLVKWGRQYIRWPS